MTALLDRAALPAVDAPEDDGLWGLRDVRITAADGGVVFEQLGAEFPVGWSDTAARIVAQKYFRGSPGAPDREWSLRQVLDRVVGTVVRWAENGGHLTAVGDSEFASGLKGLLAAQKAAFNSPVYFNLGAPDRAQQVSACFILSVEDSLEGILEWIRQEGMIFRGGSGAGVNLSPLRGSMERLTGGGIASGPVSFMAGADASAGAIRSGGKTRRAAKMVLLDVDHPDIEEFIWCKALEERKSRSLAAAGFDMGINGGGYGLRYQNANNSVRVSDEFMAAVESGVEYQLKERLTGAAVRTVDARELFRQIAEAAWEAADPGVQFSSTINRWHTCPESGRINASNPCSEYVHLDNSACNLASLNLVSFVDSAGSFDIEGFTSAVQLMITAMDALVDEADYPTALIGETTRRHRQLGLGYSNLGAALMMLGLPYDSDAGRGWAAAVTALMTGAAYETSAALAARLGPFAAWPPNAEAGLAVLRRHQAAVDGIHPAGPQDIRSAATGCWERAVAAAGEAGVRNSQVTVLAPTGTISFMMDCDTTGVEPDLALVKNKTLVGGGELRIVNGSVPRALTRLGYQPAAVAQVVANIERLGEASAEAGVRPEHVPVFATSLGRNRISPEGHIRMMAAVQPFLSGAISKTVNLDADASVEDVEELFMLSWKLGLKAVAVYRDGSKVAQPLSAGGGGESETPLGRERRELPVSRRSRTVEWRVGDAKGYMTVGEYDDGLPGEVFVRVAKQGSTLAGLADGWAIAVSHGLQWGVPLSSYVSAFRGMRFEPGGITSDPDIRFATSVFDYLVRRLALDYLDPDERQALGVVSASERAGTLPGLDTAGVEPHQPATLDTAPICVVCGGQMVPAGSCYCCQVCGTTSGCS